jgi:hypothetical protein
MGNQSGSIATAGILPVERAAIRRAQDADGRDALFDEAPAEGCHEMALHVLAYHLTWIMNIMGIA